MTDLVLLAAGDAGAAAALAPVARALDAAPDTRSRVAAHAYAAGTFSAAGVRAEAFPAALEALLTPRPGTVVTGASWREASELELVSASRARSIPTLIVLDYGSHYRERFTDRSGTLVVPDRVAVIDPVQKSALTDAGMPASLIEVTGGPQYDRIAGIARRPATERAALRGELGLAPDEWFVFFASQPIAELVGARFGYNEREVLELVVAAAEETARRHGKAVTVGIRRHPRETRIADVASSSIRVIEIEDGDALLWACSADLVTGMNSSLLLEAALAGQLVLSVQPGLIGPDVLPSNARGLSEVVYNRAQLKPSLDRALADLNWRAQWRQRLAAHPPPAGATGRVVRIIQSLLSGNSRRGDV